jgi:signal transduction histidine kinase
VYRARGNYPLALAHLEAFKRLDDEGRSVAASANVALTGARFDFARQQLEIEQLRSTQLQRDIRLRQSQQINQTLLFAAFVLGGALLIAWLAWRASMLRRHRNVISEKNATLTKTLVERDGEIARRVEIESQLRLAMETAQQASRAKSHFLANMSHELRTPLNAVIGFSEVIAQGKLPTAKCAEYAADICAGGRHLLSILNDLLDMARIESGRVTLADDIVPLADVVEHAVSVLGCEKRTDNKQVRVLPEKHDVLVRGDELRLRQIAINLISNALKFTAEDGLVEIAVERTLDGVDLVVRDNGSGIPPEKLQMILEPFGQAESTYARVHGGVGLGLPIVKSLTELHGGRLTLTSEVEKGTVARVHLPLERVVEAPTDAPSVQPRAALSITPAA